MKQMPKCVKLKVLISLAEKHSEYEGDLHKKYPVFGMDNSKDRVFSGNDEFLRGKISGKALKGVVGILLKKTD